MGFIDSFKKGLLNRITLQKSQSETFTESLSSSPEEACVDFFLLFILVASSDGEITQEEWDVLFLLIPRLEFFKDIPESVITSSIKNAFEANKRLITNGTYSLPSIVKKAVKHFKEPSELMYFLLCLIGADGELSKNEENLFREIGKIAGIPNSISEASLAGLKERCEISES